MPVKKLKDFLDQNSVKYTTIGHSRAYTAQEVAASSHIPGKEMAKTVMLKMDGKISMVVLPASCKIDFGLLKKSSGAKEVILASESEFQDLFPDCDVGAMPPFGNLYGMDVYTAEKLAEDDEIAFNAGSHTEIMRLSYKDFERLVKPRVLKFSCE